MMQEPGRAPALLFCTRNGGEIQQSGKQLATSRTREDRCISGKWNKDENLLDARQETLSS